MKKTRKILALALVFCFAMTSFASAAMPGNTIIFGDRAYDTRLLDNEEYTSQILAAFLSNENSFIVKLPNGGFFGPNLEEKSAEDIPAVVYTNEEGQETEYEANDGDEVVESEELEVVEVSAINGKVTVVLSGTPKEEPTVEDFSFDMEINGEYVGSVEPTDIAWDAETNTAVLTVPMVEQTEEVQVVQYWARYLDNDGVTSEEAKFTVEVDPQVDIVAAAEEAVKAYEDAPITNAEEIAAAEALEKVAVEKVELVADAEVKAGFETRIATKKAAVDAKKAELEEAELEKARQAEAEKAVKEYEEAPYTTLEEIELAEGLEEAARAAVELVKDEEVKTALAGRIDAQKALVDAAKAYQQLKAAVEEKVAAYEAATEDLSTQELVDAAKAAKAEIDLEGLNEEDTAAFEERIAEADAKVDAAQKELNKLEVKEVKAVNATTVEVTFVEALAEDFDLTGKTITLTAGEATLTATYEADSYLNGVANFVLAKDEALVDAVEYTVSADWAKFATDKFVAKIVAPYIKTVEVTTESVPAGTGNKVYFVAKNQYGEDIALTGNVANLNIEATLNGMPMLSSEINVDNKADGYITISKTLAEGNNLVLTFTNKIGKDTVVVGTKEFTVAKAATPVPTTIGNLKAVYINVGQPNDGKEVTALAANDVVKLTVVVKDQFGNPMTGQAVRWYVEEGEDLITVTAPATMPGDAAEMQFTANSAGNIQISAFLENGQKVTYTATIGAAKLTSLTYSSEKSTGNNNEEVVLGKVEPSSGATLTPEMIKFEVKATAPATADDVVVSARLRGGNDPDTAKQIVVVAKSSKVGTYKITPYVGASFTDENVIKAAEITLTTDYNKTVASIEVEAFAENELTANIEVKKAITFKNKHGEVIPVNAKVITALPTVGMTVTAYDKDGNSLTLGTTETAVAKLGFKAAAGDYTVTIVTGSVSKQLNLTVAAAAALKTVELGANITSGVIAGELNGTPVDPFVRIVEIKDQYGNDFIPANFTGLTVEVSDWDTLTEPTATFAYYNYNAKKEMVVDGVDGGSVAYAAAKGVALVIDANSSDNTVDKIATITVKTTDAPPVVLDTVNVTVKAVRTVKTVTLAPVSTNLALGGTTTLVVEVKDQYGDLCEVADPATDIVLPTYVAQDHAVELAYKEPAEDANGDAIPGTYIIDVEAKKAGTQEVTIGVKIGADVKASAKVTYTVKSAGEVIDSIVIDESKLEGLYSTKGAAKVIDLTTIAKDANGNVVAVPNADLMWSAVGYNAKGEVVADAVTSIEDGELTVKAEFVGTVEVKVITANLKEDTVVLNFDNADPEAVLSTLKVMYNNGSKDVVVVSPAEIKKGDTLVVFLEGLDQYSEKFTVSSGVTAFSENTAVATVTGTGNVTITGEELGTTKINLIYNGTAFSITVEVVPAAE